MEALDDFHTDHPFVDLYMTTQNEGHSQHFSKKIVFWTWWLLPILKMQLHTNMLCKMLRVNEWLKSVMSGHSFLVLMQKWHRPKLCYENSSCKLLSFNNSTNLSWAWQVCGLLKFQLYMVCVINFSWIKIHSTYETVYKAFNFSLKLLSVKTTQF